MTKLTDIRVVDLLLFLPGPMLTGMMADQGATVIKVEPPTGDPARAMGPFEAGHSIWFRNLNRGKQAIGLDLKSEAGKAALWDLLAAADVLVESFRPGVIGRLGFGYDVVAARHPGIVTSPLPRCAPSQTALLAAGWPSPMPTARTTSVPQFALRARRPGRRSLRPRFRPENGRLPPSPARA